MCVPVSFNNQASHVFHTFKRFFHLHIRAFQFILGTNIPKFCPFLSLMLVQRELCTWQWHLNVYAWLWRMLDRTCSCIFITMHTHPSVIFKLQHHLITKYLFSSVIHSTHSKRFFYHMHVCRFSGLPPHSHRSIAFAPKSDFNLLHLQMELGMLQRRMQLVAGEIDITQQQQQQQQQ